MDTQFKEYFITFLVGMVTANLFTHVLPELFTEATETNISLLLLLGIFLAGVALQYSLHHSLHPHHKTAQQFLTALHFHNITDGITIGLAILVSPQFGLAAFLGIMAHDIIHKIIAFGFLIKQGENKQQAIIKTTYTFITIGSAIFLTMLIKPSITITLLGGGFAAGSLSYVSFVLLKEVFHQTANDHKNWKIIKTTYFIAGIITMYYIFQLFQIIFTDIH